MIEIEKGRGRRRRRREERHMNTSRMWYVKIGRKEVHDANTLPQSCQVKGISVDDPSSSTSRRSSDVSFPGRCYFMSNVKGTRSDWRYTIPPPPMQGKKK